MFDIVRARTSLAFVSNSSLREAACPLRSFAQALDLKNDPGLIDEYRRHHRAVWPEVITALRGIGIQNMKIWPVGTRLFMTFDAPDDFDPRRDFQRYADVPRCRQWDAWMRLFQTPLAEAGPQEWWTPMELVFDLVSCDPTATT